MRTHHRFFDLLPNSIIGAEGEEGQEGQQGSSEGQGSDESGSGEENAGSGSEGSEDDHDDADDPKVKGLKSALEKTRRESKEKDAELKRLRGLEKDEEKRKLAEKSEVDQAKTLAEQATAKAERLAAGYLSARLEAAITKAAEKANFVDPDDAIAGVDRADLTFEQDEDDPAKVTIDVKSVEKAVKAVATRKPHFVKKGTDDGDATGSQFGGAGGNRTKTTDDDLKKRYASL